MPKKILLETTSFHRYLQWRVLASETVSRSSATISWGLASRTICTSSQWTNPRGSVATATVGRGCDVTRWERSLDL